MRRAAIEPFKAPPHIDGTSLGAKPEGPQRPAKGWPHTSVVLCKNLFRFRRCPPTAPTAAAAGTRADDHGRKNTGGAAIDTVATIHPVYQGPLGLQEKFSGLKGR